jgi:hypothetical protein
MVSATATTVVATSCPRRSKPKPPVDVLAARVGAAPFDDDRPLHPVTRQSDRSDDVERRCSVI